MSVPPCAVHTLDPSQSFVVLGGLFFVRVRALPFAKGIHDFIRRLKAARPRAWGVCHFFELEKVGLPDEETRAAYAALMRDANEAKRCTALVTERVLMESIVRSVVSGLRLVTKHDRAIETFSGLEPAARWLDGKRPEDASQVTLPSLNEALRVLREAHA